MAVSQNRLLMCLHCLIILTLPGAKTDVEHVSMRSNANTNGTEDERTIVPEVEIPLQGPRVGEVRYGGFLTGAQEEDLLKIHNDLRRTEHASNMEYMVWNDYLSEMSLDWARRCRFEHGQPYRQQSTLPHKHIGQNLYFIAPGPANVTSAIIDMYDEKVDYNFRTTHCTPGKMCGHYTQIVWSNSNEVGCATYLCPSILVPESGKYYKNAHYLVCNYGPGGNYRGKQPFEVGDQCNNCPSGENWCDLESPRGLCRKDCGLNSKHCICRANCRNGGAPDCDCRCQCPAGFHGGDCTKPCEDTSYRCMANPGWPPSWCNVDYVRAGCPKMCDLCKPAPDENDTNPPPPPPTPCPSLRTSAASLITTSSNHFMLTLFLIISSSSVIHLNNLVTT